MSRRSSVQHFSSTLCVLSLLMLSGCDKGAGSTRDQGINTPVNTGLTNIDGAPALPLPEGDELMRPDRDEERIRAQIEESARQLSVYFTNLELDGPPVTRNSDTPPPDPTSQNTVASPIQGSNQAQKRPQPNPEVAHTNNDGGVRVSLSDHAGKTTPEESEKIDQVEQPDSQTVKKPEQPQAKVDQDPIERRNELVHELAGILTELVESGQDPGASALALATLETLLPADTSTLVDEGVLSEPERASIDAVRSLLGTMTSEGEIVSPALVSEQLEEIKSQLDAWAGLTIRKAALCTRVDGYGRYETFSSYRFIAGQAHEVIVYTELDRFMQSLTMGPDGQPRYGIELSQRLELYHVADDLNTWNRGAETVSDQSRNRLRDYYLTNRVFLPANLGVGRYHLKIVMRDLIGEKLAETIIPIEIVAR